MLVCVCVCVCVCASAFVCLFVLGGVGMVIGVAMAMGGAAVGCSRGASWRGARRAAGRPMKAGRGPGGATGRAAAAVAASVSSSSSSGGRGEYDVEGLYGGRGGGVREAGERVVLASQPVAQLAKRHRGKHARMNPMVGAAVLALAAGAVLVLPGLLEKRGGKGRGGAGAGAAAAGGPMLVVPEVDEATGLPLTEEQKKAAGEAMGAAYLESLEKSAEQLAAEAAAERARQEALKLKVKEDWAKAQAAAKSGPPKRDIVAEKKAAGKLTAAELAASLNQAHQQGAEDSDLTKDLVHDRNVKPQHASETVMESEVKLDEMIQKRKDQSFGFGVTRDDNSNAF